MTSTTLRAGAEDTFDEPGSIAALLEQQRSSSAPPLPERHSVYHPPRPPYPAHPATAFVREWSERELCDPARIVSIFKSEPSQYCRFCSAYFAGPPTAHVGKHKSVLAQWRIEYRELHERLRADAEETRRLERELARRDLLETVYELHADGLSFAEIGEEIGRKPATVRNYLKEAETSVSQGRA